jgi:8-oxo-dGTP diphosphatase
MPMTDRYTVYPRTLVFLLNGENVLLIKRSERARLFPGLRNGIGGHVERGEDVLASALREVREETGLEVDRLSLCGVMHIGESQYHDAPASGGPGALVFIFVGHTDSRQVRASDEGELAWVPLDQLDDVALMPDLHDLLPRVLAVAHQPEEEQLFLATSAVG